MKYGRWIVPFGFALVLLGPADRAAAISRVGTCGIVDLTDLFQVAQAPAPYQAVKAITNSSGVALTTITGETPPLPMPGNHDGTMVLIYPLSEDYPELVGLD